ncbi:MAG TPA: ammonium transporter [Planctomycetota bacterium]|nr:ammonium transporter [Planctomycetota bacterium]
MGVPTRLLGSAKWFVMLLLCSSIGLSSGFLAGSRVWAADAPAPAAAPAEPKKEEAPAAPKAEEKPDPAKTPATLADVNAAKGDLKVGLDTGWTMIAGFLVFFMNLGFAMVESGLCRAKNCVNILAKNFIVFACASIGFYVIGWGLMFGTDVGGFVGGEGVFMVGGADNSPATGTDYKGAYASISWSGIPLWCKFFFQLVFAGTAATIVSGVVAERIKFGAFCLFSVILCAVIYPIVGHMIWGGGMLGAGGMFDFAGSTVVHSVGGWAALAGVIVLGPRLGKYGSKGEVNAIPGHNMTSVTLGALVLWFGWFGFNPGSTMALDAPSIGHIAVTTNMAAAAATLTSAITAWLLLGKPDLSMIVNGTLAGLVAITAPCAFVSVPSSLIIGAVAGVLVVFAVLFFDKVKLDDPVGALSVHLVCGIFGTICVGLFAKKDLCPAAVAADGLFMGGGMTQLIPQIKGVVVAGVVTFVLSLVSWFVLKATLGIRVSAEEELEGLDIGEHGTRAYPDFESMGASPIHGSPISVPARAMKTATEPA